MSYNVSLSHNYNQPLGTSSSYKPVIACNYFIAYKQMCRSNKFHPKTVRQESERTDHVL